MEKSVKITSIIVGGVILLSLIIAGAIISFGNSSYDKTISSEGISTLKVTPDLVTVNFNVETTADNAEEASDENAEIVEALKNRLTKKGFSREEIVTTNFNVYPDYSWNNGVRKLIGYKATHNLQVEISEGRFDDIGEVIDVGVESGALISYVNFALTQEKQSEYKVEAIELATKDAKAKAEAIAEGLDRNLGQIVSVSESSFGYNPWVLYDARGSEAMNSDVAEDAKMAVETNINAGEQEVTARVAVVYGIR